MSTDSEPDLARHEKWSMWAWASGLILLLLFTVVGAGMMRGWFSFLTQQTAETDDEKAKKEKKDKEKEEKKNEVDILFPVVQPAEPEAPLSYAKPGHWANATQTMRANFKDFVGDSHTVLANSKETPYPVKDTPFVLRGSRPVLLTKGQPKAIDNTIFIPQTDQPMQLAVALEERGLGVPLPALRTPVTAMPSYQYHLVILAKEPSRYSYIKTLDSVAVPFGGQTDYDEIARHLHYRVVTMDVRQSIPLSDNPLTWSSIAYIVWDEVDPQLFTPAQERAIVDWIHWGGNLIVSGPDSIDSLKDSFLGKYLPADSAGARTFAAEDFQQMNQARGDGWAVSTPMNPGKPINPTKPWSGVRLELRKDREASEVPGTGGVLVERRVGLGRVVMSAVQLSQRELINWRSGFENFFNGAVLRRPGREYVAGTLGPATLLWRDENLQGRRLDARLTTNVRYFARDLGVDTSYRFRENRDNVNQFGQQEVINEYLPSEATGGIGAWNDFSLTADAARSALREAAGVEVPNSQFVVLCLAIYLVALVPLNWLIFQTLGRVEWAWIAAPVIAIIGTFVVVNQAQLDIGFVRAQTEIGLLEQQPNYGRAHLSRYTALYTSLSTTYDVEFENLTSLAAPFPASANFQMLVGQGFPNVDFSRYDNVRLSGLPISSNSTGMVHSEQMVSLDGAIRLGTTKATGGLQLENGSKLDLRSVCVVKREGDQLHGRWIGRLTPGSSTPLALERRLDTSQPVFTSDRAAENQDEQLNLEPMFRLALDPKQIGDGETRLVARVDEVLAGELITPAASQVRGAALVVAHLEYAKLRSPGRDRNTKRDVKGAAEFELDEDETDDI